MKAVRVPLLLTYLICLFSCSSNNEKLNETNSILGRWKLVEAKISAGGPSYWVDVEDGTEYTFFNDGTFVSDDFLNCSSGNFETTSSGLNLMYDCQNVKDKFELSNGAISYNFDFENDDLLLTPTTIICIEGCIYKYKKLPDEPVFKYEFKKENFIHDLTNTTIPYSFFEPEHVSNSNEKFPLIIALHGAEFFLNSKDFFLSEEYISYFAQAWIEEDNQKKYPTYVVAPNLHKEIWENNDLYFGWDGTNSVDFVNELLDFIIANNQIDPNRIYITGHSMGGAGTWYLGAKFIDKIAAIVPLSSAFTDNINYVKDEIDSGTFKNLPVWNFIHRLDDGVEKSRALFSALENKNYSTVYTHTFGTENYNLSEQDILNEINADKKYFHTEYNYVCEGGIGDCHFAMNVALKEPLLFEWLFKQKRN